MKFDPYRLTSGVGRGGGERGLDAGSRSRVPVRVRRSKPYGNLGAQLYDYDTFTRPPKYKYLCYLHTQYQLIGLFACICSSSRNRNLLTRNMRVFEQSRKKDQHSTGNGKMLLQLGIQCNKHRTDWFGATIVRDSKPV